MDPYVRARELIDQAHCADPHRAADGRAAELVYAERMENWMARLVLDASALLRLAARSQHLERWSVPRASFPMDRPGYLAWRRSLYTKQAERARELLLQAGVTADEAAEVATWVSKTGLKKNPGTQALEDRRLPRLPRKRNCRLCGPTHGLPAREVRRYFAENVAQDESPRA